MQRGNPIIVANHFVVALIFIQRHEKCMRSTPNYGTIRTSIFNYQFSFAICYRFLLCKFILVFSLQWLSERNHFLWGNFKFRLKIARIKRMPNNDALLEGISAQHSNAFQWLNLRLSLNRILRNIVHSCWAAAVLRLPIVFEWKVILKTKATTSNRQQRYCLISIHQPNLHQIRSESENSNLLLPEFWIYCIVFVFLFCFVFFFPSHSFFRCYHCFITTPLSNQHCSKGLKIKQFLRKSNESIFKKNLYFFVFHNWLLMINSAATKQTKKHLFFACSYLQWKLKRRSHIKHQKKRSI